MTTLVFGHKNPDTDSVASAIALSDLKNKLGYKTVPCVLGNISKETQYVLDYLSVTAPTYIENVKTQIKDLDYDKVPGIAPTSSILAAYKLMESINLRTIPVVSTNDKLIGIVTMKDIAMELIKGDFYRLHTSISNIVRDLNGEILVGDDDEIEGKISVIAYYYKNAQGFLGENDIIIVGDRYDIIECAIEAKVKLIIITGGNELPKKYLDLAREQNVPIISVPLDTYTTSKLINQCNYVSFIMKGTGLVKFTQEQYLEEVQEEIINTNFRNYPVVTVQNVFLGFINKKQILNPGKKKVILVDHNEYSQSAEGLCDAEIKEIVDHHKIGDISTSKPINFRNMPVGSTCTIIYNMFKESRVELTREIAGLLMSGILSDTLLFKSPTTTDIDKAAVAELNSNLNLDIEKYAMEMFKVGSSLEGHSIEEVFYRDFKEFNVEGYNMGVGQVFTLDIEDVFNRKEQFIEFVGETHDIKNYSLTLLLITDIIKEGSYLIYKCKNNTLLSTAFNVTPVQGVFVPELVSRKKQVIPKLLEAINIIK